MGTTLTKPVLLDETGQDIVDKLDEIKTAIGSTGEFIPVMIKITTPPTKTTYGAGETLDLTGMVVTLYASNGMTFDVTGDCTFSPANGATLTSQDTSVAVSYTWYETQTTFTASQVLTIKTLTSIAVTTPPTLTEYYAGETLDLTGIVVTATFDNGSTQVVTSDCTFSPANGATLSTSDTAVTVSYTESGVTKTASQAISVTAPIYGVQWDRSASTAMTRTDLAADFEDPVPYYPGMTGEPSSPFDNIMPWAGIEEVEDPDLGLMVKIPKFWYKLIAADPDDSYYFKLQISPVALDGFSVSPAHMDRGDGYGERDYVYVGACPIDSSYKSVPSSNAKIGQYITDYRTGIHALGDDAWIWDYATYVTIQFLYLVEFADWNSQAKIGMGFLVKNYATNSQKSYSYHTGYSLADKTSVDGTVTYRYIRHLWGNVACFVDGLKIQGGSGGRGFTVSAEINPSNFQSSSMHYNTQVYYSGSDSYWSGDGTSIRFWTQPGPAGYEWILIPYSNGGTGYDSYIPDIWKAVGTYGHFMNYYAESINSYKTRSGLFSWDMRPSSGYSLTMCGARSMKLPSNT